MSIGGSILVLAIGAILRFAVNADIADVDLDVVGLILMIAGALGLVIALAMLVMAGSRDDTRPPDPPGPPGSTGPRGTPY